jgi:hypothetical protein
MSSRRLCAFCHREAKLSGEHVWSNWINDILGDKRTYNFKRFAPDGTILNEWTSSELDLTLKVVCESCNNGWMSGLEAQHAMPCLAPLIERRRLSILPSAGPSISAFAFKTQVIADHSHPTRGPFFSRGVRTSFKQSLRLPAHTQVWLAMAKTPGEIKGFLQHYYLQLRSGRHRDVEAYAVTFGLTPFVLQIVSYRWMDPAKRGGPLPVITMDPVWNACSMVIRPTPVDYISWPFRTALDVEGIDIFHRRILNLQTRRKRASKHTPLY